MPFTFSHPALVLPFARIKHGCVSALVVGSMVPDFQYFILMKLSGRFSHSLPGMVLFDLPVALLLLVLFHGVVKKPLIDNLPRYFSARLQPLKQFDFLVYARQHPVGLLLCILIGALSHIVWDGFTHAEGLFSGALPGLLTPVQVATLPKLPLYRYLQHASTVLGAGAILWVFHRLQAVEPGTKPTYSYWGIVAVFFTVAYITRASFGIGYYGDAIAVGISCACIGLVMAGALWNVRSNRT